jgi:hypothetical protein
MSEADSWRQEPSKKASDIARDAELLARRARSAGLETTAYILELAANEARKDAERMETTGVRKR